MSAPSELQNVVLYGVPEHLTPRNQSVTLLARSYGMRRNLMDYISNILVSAYIQAICQKAALEEFLVTRYADSVKFIAYHISTVIVQEEDIATMILAMMTIADVILMSHTCRVMHRIGQGVVHRRFRSIIAPFVDSAFDLLVSALRQSESLVTGSAARAMMTGDISYDIQDLNILVPHLNFDVLHDFLMETVGYRQISDHCHPAIVQVVEHFGKYAWNCRVITLACPKSDMHILHLILNAPSTADMVYMTTGGVTCFYLQWMRQSISILSYTGNLVQWDNKLGCAGEFLDELKVEKDTQFINSDCRNRCPTLWHHTSNKRLRHSVDWDITDSVTCTFHNIDIEWRLNMYCGNNACHFNFSTMASNLNGEGAINYVKYIPKEIRCRKPKFAHLIQAAFYGAGCYRPFLVPVPINDGVKKKPTLDDLYLLEHMARMSGSTTSVKGSVLVVKQSLLADKPIVDMNKDDMFTANIIISSALYHGIL
ncbi:hypothetical protein DFJ58DRAFT_844244 [Suillus subalutaceus]|uniref:uncharacterized protein n=1 Tax=Suillus subalutaceus TaxID=48586 RepID=UPI001B86CC5A|nr:uncharacterized protein DFJ58DRAFT_844244 [Suillus subalutaceus]KAG1843828.1 hypothetical protein DFJ58DRAFT_844244 [Suillus subalutaceus]